VHAYANGERSRSLTPWRSSSAYERPPRAARGWSVQWYDRERAFRAAAAALGREDVDGLPSAMGRSVGPPWQAKHKLAAAAALAAISKRPLKGESISS
jgi:hypothetical protein